MGVNCSLLFLFSNNSIPPGILAQAKEWKNTTENLMEVGLHQEGEKFIQLSSFKKNRHSTPINPKMTFSGFWSNCTATVAGIILKINNLKGSTRKKYFFKKKCSGKNIHIPCAVLQHTNTTFYILSPPHTLLTWNYLPQSNFSKLEKG